MPSPAPNAQKEANCSTTYVMYVAVTDCIKWLMTLPLFFLPYHLLCGAVRHGFRLLATCLQSLSTASGVSSLPARPHYWPLPHNSSGHITPLRLHIFFRISNIFRNISCNFGLKCCGQGQKKVGECRQIPSG